MAIALLAGFLAGSGCQTAVNNAGGPINTGLLVTLDLTQPTAPIVRTGELQLAGARNETLGFSLQTAIVAGGRRVSALRWIAPRETTTQAIVPGSSLAAWQIVPVPVDLNRAGFVRQTGLSADSPNQPRALLPLPAVEGMIGLKPLRDPAHAADPTPANSGAAALWLDLHLPASAAAGEYAGRIDLLDADNHALASLPVKLTVYDFALPSERHLQLVAPLDWDRLSALYADRLEAIRPILVNRQEPRFAKAVQTLDQLIAMAQADRCVAYVPRLGPVVKWPVGQPPEVEWDDFVGLAEPWMNGSAFADHQPLGLWPMPRPDLLPRFDRKSQLDYWQNAANRFDQNDWLTRTAIIVDPPHAGRLGAADSLELSSFVGDVLKVQSHVRVAVPMETDQVVLASDQQPNRVDPRQANRLMCSAPGLVFSPPMQSWPAGVARPQQWLRTDLPGLLPTTGAGGGERDVRLFAWLAYLRQAEFVLFPGALPTQDDLATPAAPTDLTWFYPGQWFGVDAPVPTLQLKWLRRAEQDFEYLWLAKSRGDTIGPLLMARAITRPVQVLDNESPDPVDTLLCGTTDAGAWAAALPVLASRITAHVPGQTIDPAIDRSTSMATLHWLEPQDRQFQIARDVQYLLDRPGGEDVTLKLGIELYNASDDTPSANSLGWSAVPKNWTIAPQALSLPSLGMFRITPANLSAIVHLDQLARSPHGSSPQPAEWVFTNGYTRSTYAMRATVPIAAVDRRDNPLKIDGSLEDWDAADAIQNGPMIRMLDRPSLQRQAMSMASTPSKVYASWADDNFYCAFHVENVTQPSIFATQNFVDYQDRRAWGEDVCEVLIQPQYDDNSLGAVSHIIVKPTGQWIEKLYDRRTHVEAEETIASASIRYAGTVDGDVWRGELAIPWKSLLDPGRDRPTLLRFNFVQHVNATGETASWAGPVDFGRDTTFMGLLDLRDAGGNGALRQ